MIAPEKEQVYDVLRQFPQADYLFPNRMLHRFFDEEGIRYLDLLQPFRKYANQKARIMLDSEKDLYWC